MSYLDTLEYVAWLNGKVGAEVYRLPTEAEWEYAARAGTDTPFPQDEGLSPDQANFSRQATDNLLGESRPDLEDREMPVTVNKLDAANGWGVRHMSGNVSELTLSCWSAEHLGLTSDNASLAIAEAARTCNRVAKVADFGTAMDGLRPAACNRPAGDRRRGYLGFRVVRELDIKGGA
jgi:formylglycine-generating enzyme required for sulfatase activity